MERQHGIRNATQRLRRASRTYRFKPTNTLNGIIGGVERKKDEQENKRSKQTPAI